MVQVGVAVAFDGATTLTQEGQQAAGLLIERLAASQRITHIQTIPARRASGVLHQSPAHDGEGRLGRHDVGVETGQSLADVVLHGAQLGLLTGVLARPGLQRPQVTPGDEHADGPQLSLQTVMTTGGVGLAFQRTPLAPDLTQ